MLFNLVLIIHDKKTQAMILGNPFQELVLHIGDCYFFFFFKEMIFPLNFLMILDTICINLKLFKRNKIVLIDQYNVNDHFLPSGKFLKFCLNVIFIQMKAGVMLV